MQRRRRPFVLAAALLAMTWHAARADTSFDIVGLRLGMTLAQARAALQAHDPKVKIEEQRRYFGYSDGINNQLRSEDFVFWLSASRFVVEGNQQGSENLTLYFSPKPGEQRVIGIGRIQSGMPNPPTGRQYRDALVAKYGKPSSEDSSGLVRWEFPAGKSNCMTKSVHRLSSGKSILIPIYGNPTGNPDRFQKPGVKSLSDCASYLQYTVGLPTRPATEVRALMLDVEAAARGELAANQWVSELREKARKAREAKGKGPTL